MEVIKNSFIISIAMKKFHPKTVAEEYDKLLKTAEDNGLEDSTQLPAANAIVTRDKTKKELREIFPEGKYDIYPNRIHKQFNDQNPDDRTRFCFGEEPQPHGMEAARNWKLGDACLN